MLQVLYKALELAISGDRHMIKLLLELHIPKQVANDDESAGKNQVNVLIQQADQPAKVTAKVISNHEQSESTESGSEAAGHPDDQSSGTEG